MAGDDGKGKYITPPEDLLEPVEVPPGWQVEAEVGLVRKTLRILEDQTGYLYINPDAQHIGSMQSSTDIIRIYSREIQALRKVVGLLMILCTRQMEIIPTDNLNTLPLVKYAKVRKYLENASWEWSLINDPRLAESHPG